MSLQQIKSDLETFLRTNLTTVAIKFKNTNYYELNGVPLTETQINALTTFVQPNISSISSDIEILNTVDNTNYLGLFEFLIYAKKGTGTGGMYTIGDALKTAFKKQTINGIKTLNFSYENDQESGEWIILPCSISCQKWSD